jgi:hypothetical protein
MVDLLERFSESTGIYALMTMPWSWPIAESLHFVGLSLLIGTVGLFDLRMLGMARRFSLAALHRLVPLGVAGYGLNVITGTMFLTSYPDQYLYNPAFQTKIAFMIGAGINLVIFYTTTFRQVKALSPDQDASGPAQLIALVSLCCWLGVISGGRLITFYRPPYFWCFWCS